MMTSSTCNANANVRTLDLISEGNRRIMPHATRSRKALADTAEADKNGTDPDKEDTTAAPTAAAEEDVVVTYTPANLIPFSYPDFTDKGEKSMNILLVGPVSEDIIKAIQKLATEDKKRKSKFKIFHVKSLSSESLHSFVSEKTQIHFVFIFIDADDPLGLKIASDELACLDPLFLGRERISFWLLKKLYITTKGEREVDQINSDQLLGFMKTIGQLVRTIYTDKGDSIEANTRQMYNMVKRLLTQPFMS